MTDLRSFLDRCRQERRSEFLEVEREVNQRREPTAILTKLEQMQRLPIALFKNVAGSRFPLVSNVCGSMGRLALALDCPVRAVADRYAEACDHLIPPEVTRNAPVQENVLRGAEVDLGLLPQLVYHQDDTDRPFITAAIVFARDRETLRGNLSYHR